MHPIPKFVSLTLKRKWVTTLMVGIILQEGENIDRALRRFKKKYERSGVLKEYKRRTFFTKPSVEARTEQLKAIRRAQKINQENF